MKHLRIHIAFFCLLGLSLVTKAQDKSLSTKAMVEMKNYIFIAQSATPSGGQFIPLTSQYDLTVRGDTVISYLPYFGRAYSAPINNEGGIKFTSAKTNYKAERKNDKWQIIIKPNAVDVQQFYLTIYDNERASLQVISTNRQTISFDGYVKEGMPLDKKAF
ncbi:MAG: DUF4251 domain-containing protein [Chitinophagaceae bacterium]